MASTVYETEISDGEVARVLASHQCGLGSIPAHFFMWVEFVVSSRLAPRVFLGILWFSSLHENQRSKFQFDQHRRPAWKLAKAGVALFLTYSFVRSFVHSFTYVAGTTQNVA